ncbi:MAG: ComF family protein [Gammaproteobacteria bacterium]|nr:ComF family protein [Gammaproteobacteria bacterium]
MKCFLKFCSSLIKKTILPYHCVLCLNVSDQQRDLCRQCEIELPVSSHTCPQCGIALPITSHQYRCAQCIKHLPYFNDTVVGFNYQTPINFWLKQFKFHKKGLYARILTEIYAEKIALLFEKHPETRPQLLVPVPLHWRRIAHRGFNQAYIIAQQLSQKLQIPMCRHSHVTRIKYTQPQAKLNQQLRNRNINGAFYVQNLFGIKHIAIVDDVITTGNTVNELSKQLKKQGVQHVSVWAVARTN